MNKLFLIFCVMTCGVSYLYADVAVLDPVADSPLFQFSPNTNYGTQHYGYWGYFNGGQRTLLLYDVSSINGAVISAQLSWQCYSNTGSGADMWACVVTGGTWNEYSVTWNTQPSHDDSESSRLLDIPWDNSSSIVTHDCTAYAVSIIQDWINNPSTNCGMILKKNPESGNEPRCYPYMRESIYQPVQLIVEYTPTALERRTFAQIKTLFQ